MVRPFVTAAFLALSANETDAQISILDPTEHRRSAPRPLFGRLVHVPVR